ncbi:MAG: aldo/keto reductase [Clostridiales bacterium]|nr:aldo/keto reductase [Clostridiales bacterium]
MIYRENTRNKDQLSILGFGCMRFPQKDGKIDEVRSTQMLKQAIDGGVNYLDTAWPYHAGQSEAFLGRFFKKTGLRNQIFLATKLPIWLCRNRNDFDKYINKQLVKLNTDYIDYYLMHMFTSYGNYKNLCDMGLKEYLKSIKDSGKAKNVGFSFHGEKSDFIKIVDDYDWDFCQIQYNILDINNQAGRDGLLHANKKGIPVIIMEPLRGGALANNIPQKVLDLIDKAGIKKTPVELFLSWVMNHKEATVVLSGMSHEDHIENNLEIASDIDGKIKEEEQVVIDEIIDVFVKSFKVPCTGCGYCIDCPKEIDIPRCFEVYNHISSGGFLGTLMQIGISGKTLNKARECIQCGKCEKHCPQSIDIINQLNIISSKWYIRLLFPITNWYMEKRGKKTYKK